MKHGVTLAACLVRRGTFAGMNIGIFIFDGAEELESAGVSAGIDMALHLVARLDSPERAEQVRRYMQYETPVAV